MKVCPDCNGEGAFVYEDGDHTHSLVCDRCNGTGAIDE
jgi:DnaJ-class molecular chaperone